LKRFDLKLGFSFSLKKISPEKTRKKKTENKEGIINQKERENRRIEENTRKKRKIQKSFIKKLSEILSERFEILNFFIMNSYD